MANLYTLFYGLLNFLLLAAAAAAFVLSIVARKKYPKRATYAMIGFGLLTLTGLIAFVWQFASVRLIGSSDAYEAYRIVSMGVFVVETLLQVAGIGMLVLALFRSEETQQQPVAQQQPYPGQQPQQYQPYQQQPQQPQQQYPGQQYPQQYPGQHPGQSGQQYPGRGY